MAPCAPVAGREDTIPSRRDQMRHDWLTVGEGLNLVVQGAPPPRRTLVLAKIFKPGFDEESLQKPTVFGHILEDAPGISAIASALLPKVLDRLQEFCAVLG